MRERKEIIFAVCSYKTVLLTARCAYKSRNNIVNPSHFPGVYFKSSVLCPLLFILYTILLSHLIKSSSVDHYLHTNDSRLFISLFQCSFSTSLAQLPIVVKQISQRMSFSLLCLNRIHLNWPTCPITKSLAFQCTFPLTLLP